MSADWRTMYQLDSEALAATEEPIEDWVDKYIPADDLPDVRAAIDRAIRTRSLFKLEHRVRLADGGIGWVLSRAVPLFDAEGGIVEWFGTGMDVTDRRAATERLHEAEERYRTDLERQVRERTAELRDSRDLLEATMDSSPDMIQVFEAMRDEAGRIRDFRWILNNHTSQSRFGEVRGESLLQRNPGVVAEASSTPFGRWWKPASPTSPSVITRTSSSTAGSSNRW